MRSLHAALKLFTLTSTVALVAGCSMTKLAVGTQAEVMTTASPVIEEQTDYEFAKAAIPASVLQAEGLLKITPEDPHLLLLAARGNASYAYGFVEDEKDRAEQRGELEESDYHRGRARDLYLKGRDYGLRLLELEAPELKSQLKRDPDALKKYLVEHFDEKEDAPALFWTGYAWGSAIGVSRDDLTLVADIALASVFVERSVELDETFYNAAGHTFLGVVNSSRGESVGGDPEKGKRHFERALALTGRNYLLAHVNYAQYYAVQKQDRALFDALLKEVFANEAPARPTLTLPNIIAKRRANRLAARADNLILPPLPEEPAPAESSTKPAPPAPGPTPQTTTPTPATAPAAKPTAPAPATSAGKPAAKPTAVPPPAVKPAPAPPAAPASASPPTKPAKPTASAPAKP